MWIVLSASTKLTFRLLDDFGGCGVFYDTYDWFAVTVAVVGVVVSGLVVNVVAVACFWDCCGNVVTKLVLGKIAFDIFSETRSAW